ncbi:hypothetical protein CRENBAI_011710 [Crenichthys baileyi]|uniref:Secreted protein n=1 Tax=Crenichthys baileyi TaxID=28760 RepID=A0AAV9S7T3_9TELE
MAASLLSVYPRAAVATVAPCAGTGIPLSSAQTATPPGAESRPQAAQEPSPKATHTSQEWQQARHYNCNCSTHNQGTREAQPGKHPIAKSA